MNKLFYVFIFFYVLSLNAQNAPSAYQKSGSALEIPDISLIINSGGYFTDNSDDENRGKFKIDEAELGIQSYLYPSIRTDFIAAFEQEYEEDSITSETDIEEAYLTFLELPWSLQGTIGRRLIPIGRTNPVHPHHWAFTASPLVLETLFGEHSLNDDGLELSYLIPFDLYLKVSAGIWNGKKPGHDHEHGEEIIETDDADESGDSESTGNLHQDFGEETITWNGKIYTGRLYMDLELSKDFHVEPGYTILKDEGSEHTLHEADLMLSMSIPSSYQRIDWLTEYYFWEDKLLDTKPSGLFSNIVYTLDKNWQAGVQYDWTEYADNDEKDESVYGAFVTYFMTHTSYIRGHFQTREDGNSEKENILYLQLCWGMGPHSHTMNQ